MQSVSVVVSKRIASDVQLATEIIESASKYKSEIWVEKDGRRANAKSLLGMLSLGLVVSCSLTIIADGSDEYDAVKSLGEMVTMC